MQDRLIDYVERRHDRLFALIGDLVRRNSENTPPIGNESECQQYAVIRSAAVGWEPDLTNSTCWIARSSSVRWAAVWRAAEHGLSPTGPRRRPLVDPLRPL